uniref:hypothetical protein n=1 Tax=Lachnoclostridium phocaeense TaxID=1871021 RepID=UPI0026DCE380|nr:hypothetical protein [Lachnoclostridium phocaeense]
MRLHKNEEDMVINGYVEQETVGRYPFAIKRVFEIPYYFYEGDIYFRLWDIATLIDIRHSNRIVELIKRNVKKKDLLSGAATKSFRDESDTENTTFIAGFTILHILKSQKKWENEVIVGEIKREISQLCKRRTRHD